MRITGMKVKGAGMYPVIQKPLQPTKHKYGAVATWSQCTDTFKPTLSGHGVDVEINAFKYNLQVTTLIAPLTDDVYSGQIQELAKTGRISFGLYFLTWAWENPNTKVLETLPVWSGTVFTQKEADLGIITQDLVGTKRTVNYYTIDTPLYKLSSGKYGYNDLTHEMGQIDVITGSINQQLKWFKDLLGYYPSYSSYSYGRHILDDLLIPKFVATRGNTNYGSLYSYDFERSKAIDRMIVSTFNYNIRDYGMTEALNRSSTAITSAITNSGWFNDFSHWHWAETYGDKNQWEQFFSQQRNLIRSKDVVSLGYDEAMEYMFLRNMVRRSGLFVDGNDLIIITDTKDNNNPALPLDRIKTSLSIDVDLTGTILQDKEIKGVGDRGIRKLGSNHFVVEVPYSKKDGFNTVRLQETTTPGYSNFSLPIIQSVVRNGSLLIITTDKPTNIVVFGTPLNGQLYTASVLKRDSTLSTTHTIIVKDINFSIYDIYIGVITKEKQSILSAKYNL